MSKEMLPALKRRIGEGLLAVADAGGMLLSLSGAAAVAFLGKLMFAIVLAAVALGFFLRLTGRRRARSLAPPALPFWGRAVAATLAVVEVVALVEATNFPVRFDQTGFAPWHWALVVVALLVAYGLNVYVVQRVASKRARPQELGID
ncbi:MAG: hypothetical protein AB7I35_21250 [Ramlibacter sp.]